MPILRVRYHHGLEIEYLTKGEDYYIHYTSPTQRRNPRYWAHSTYFINAQRNCGTYIDTYKVNKALASGGLEIIRGMPRPTHVTN